MENNPQSNARLLSLDVFRGATIAGMMLVNNPGDWGHIYPPFEHAAWNGWTYTDTIFPFFLWIVGVAMTFSFAKRIERGADTKRLAMHVLARSASIVGIGLFLNGFSFGLLFGHDFSFATMRFPGVLQRIGICYLVAGLVVLKTSWRQQAWIILGLLVVYWMAMFLIPVPGYGAGVLDPKGNLCWFIDSNVFGRHTWTGAPVPGFDPEGLFSTLPAIATTLFGVLTGHLLRSPRSKEDKVILMFVAGDVLLFAGMVMDNWLPINKNMWTSSYAVFMAGLAMNVLGLLYWIIDTKGYVRWAKPFAIYGLNAITMFVLAGLFGRLGWIIKLHDAAGNVITLKTWYYHLLFTPIASPMIASFLHSLAWVAGLYLIAWIMYKKNWVLKV